MGLGPRTFLEKPNPSREPGFVELYRVFGCTNSLTLKARGSLDPRLLGRTGSVQCLLVFRADRVYRKVRSGSHPRPVSPLMNVYYSENIARYLLVFVRDPSARFLMQREQDETEHRRFLFAHVSIIWTLRTFSVLCSSRVVMM